MRLDRGVFAIDAAAHTDLLVALIRDSRTELRRSGVLVPLSGGLDSSTVLLLCARAVGPEQVTALLMPEKQGNPEALRYARLVADRHGIRTLTRDVSGVLRALGAYRFVLSAVPFRPLQSWAARAYLTSSDRKPFLEIVRGEARALERRGYATYLAKQRVRMVVEYLVAEERNLLVVGAAQKSEDLVGLFVKFGADDLADVMPLKHLYRSQIVQLAEFLGVPDEILARTPNPDIIPGVSDKYLDILGLPWESVDLTLYGIEHGLEDDDIARQLALPIEKVRDVRELVALTAHMRSPSRSLSWEA